MPLPVIGGKQATWICEFCYTLAFGDRVPASWDMVWQSSVCGDCRERVAADGGYWVVKCGAYATGPDPREQAMSVREQLAAGVARVRVAFDLGGPLPVPDWPRCGEIAIECRCDTLRMSVTSGTRGRVNAADTCGAGAGHLFFAGSRSRVEAHRDGSLAYWLTIRLMYCDQPWNSFTKPAYPTADFDALLAALEAGAVPPDVPPDRAETWHDRPGML